jgi:hypothetical protein
MHFLPNALKYKGILNAVLQANQILQYMQIKLYIFKGVSLKVGTNEKWGGSRRWQMIRVYLGLWWSMSFCLLIWRPSCMKSVSSSAYSSSIIKRWPTDFCTVQMYCIPFLVCTVLAHFFTFTMIFVPLSSNWLLRPYDLAPHPPPPSKMCIFPYWWGGGGGWVNLLNNGAANKKLF